MRVRGIRGLLRRGGRRYIGMFSGENIEPVMALRFYWLDIWLSGSTTRC